MKVSRRFQFWGKATHEIYSHWVTPFLLLSLVFTHSKTVNGAPLDQDDEGITLQEEEVPQQSQVISHHRSQHHHLIQRVNPNLKQIMAARGDEEEAAPSHEDLEISLPKLEAVGRLLEKYKQLEQEANEERQVEEELEQQEPEGDFAARQEMSRGRSTNEKLARALWTQDYERRASELCGTNASLQCGKRILNLIEGQEKELDIPMKCDLRDDFLKCIDTQKRDCLELAESSVLPQLPPKEMIRVERSKLWKVLWAAGGCVLAN